MSSDLSPVADILSKLPFYRLETNKKLSLAEFLKLIGLEFDEETKKYRIKINSLEGSSDDLQKKLNELTANDYHILISEIMNRFIMCEKEWDKTQQQIEPEIGHASCTGDLQSEVEELQRENELLKKKISQHSVEFEEQQRELKQYRDLVEKCTKLQKENEKLDNLVYKLHQKIQETEKSTPPKPTSENKAHRVALIKRAEGRYKFVRGQEEHLKKRLQKFAKEREMDYEDFRKDPRYVKIWKEYPHAVDTADNTISFLRENKYTIENLEVRWPGPRGKLYRIVEVFHHQGAGGREAAQEILDTDDAEFKD